MKMYTRNEKALGWLATSVVAFIIFFALFRSQLGGGANTGGVFPAPILIVGLLGMPVSGICVLVFAVRSFLSRKDDSK